MSIMHLSGLSLQNFRNYTSKTFLFPNQTTIILAPNASGKTNILEAVQMLATGESFRAGNVEDFIQIGQDYGRIKGKVTDDADEKNEIELLLTRGMVNGKRSAKKIFRVNEVRKMKKAVIGQLPVVSFIPEDLRLITGSPSRRRSFINDTISQLDPEYTYSLTAYDQALKRRNKLLQLIKDGRANETALTFWNNTIVKHGSYVQEQRRNIFDQLNIIPFPLEMKIVYTLSVISDARLQQYANTEIAVGHTMVGPHKDDFMVNFNISGQKNSLQPTTYNLQPLSTHGSRGQQRMGVLWLKIGMFELLKTKNNTPPLLLLDDIFSELDKTNRNLVLDLTAQTQTILTSAEEEVLELEELKTADVVRL